MGLYELWKLGTFRILLHHSSISLKRFVRNTKGSDRLESFLSKVAFDSNLRKKLARTEHVLIVKVYLEIRKIVKVFMTHWKLFFRKSLSKVTFERKLSITTLSCYTCCYATFVCIHVISFAQQALKLWAINWWATFPCIFGGYVVVKLWFTSATVLWLS